MGLTQIGRFNEPDKKVIHFSDLLLDSGGSDKVHLILIS